MSQFTDHLHEQVREKSLKEGGPPLDVLFRTARSHNGFTSRAVDRSKLLELYDLMKYGPTSANCSPMRVIFVVSEEAKTSLLTAISPGNVEKTRSAPVTAIIGYDIAFYTKADVLFPHKPAMYEGFMKDENLAYITAVRNGTLQAAYLMLAARALGLDCGPMSGFDEEKLNRIFFKNTNIRVNFLCNLGYGDPSNLYPRLPRLAFQDACSVI